jgi:hypothetical protein
MARPARHLDLRQIPTAGRRQPGARPRASGPPDVVVPPIGLTCARSPRVNVGRMNFHRRRHRAARAGAKSATCAAGCACSGPGPGGARHRRPQRPSQGKSGPAARPGRRRLEQFILRLQDQAREARAARCRSSPAAATNSSSMPWSASPPAADCRRAARPGRTAGRRGRRLDPPAA